MGFKTVLILVSTTLLPISIGAEESESKKREARVIWESAAPTCYDKTLEVDKRLETVPQFKVGGKITEPKMVNAPKLTINELEQTQERPWQLIFEIVINTAGKPELVLSLKAGFPRMESLVGENFAKWTWEPPTEDGQPTCVRYIVTHRIHYQ